MMHTERDKTTLVIPSRRVNLVLQTPDEVIAWVDTLPPEIRAEFSPDWIERVRKTETGDYWHLAFSIVRHDGVTVGSCAFKGGPDANGTVEIGYGIDTEHQRQGFATEATDALVGFAFASGKVSTVRAHTLPTNIASIRVVTKCGFSLIGDVIDPEDGLVNRWEINHSK